MSTVRFKLDDEQLPFPSTPSPESSYQKLRTRIEKKSKCAGPDWQTRPAERADFGPDAETAAQKPAEKTEPPGPSRCALLQPNGSSPGHPVAPVLQHTSGGFVRSMAKTMDSSLVHYSPTRVHPAPDYQSLHQELFNGRMERPAVGAAERQRKGGAQSGQLGRAAAAHALPPDAPDTDLCLSMVHETRPSYQMKTRGKQPLSLPHLTALIDQPLPSPPASHSPSGLSRAAYSPTSAYSQTRDITSSFKLNQKLTAAPVPPPAPHAASSFLSKKIAPDLPKASSYSPHRTQSPMASGYDAKPARTFNDYDPNDILCDLQSSVGQGGRHSAFPLPRPQPHPRRSPSPVFSAPLGSRVTNIPVFVGSSVNESSKCSTSNFFVSPNARGLAPAPSDQPVRNPAKYGVEANIDAMTIRMMSNMQTGYGALGNDNCVKCGEGIFPDRPGCIALNKTYHIDCFTCTTCKCRLSGSPFYAVEENHYCEKDYLDTLEKCATCQKTIKDRILRAGGRAYHPQCFTCTCCFRQLDGVPFTVDANSQNYCLQCFHEKFAPRCASCHKPIAPVEGQKETTRVVAMDRSYHVECYVCEDCGLKLSSAIEGHGCYPLDNHLLCKNCNMKRLKRLTAP